MDNRYYLLALNRMDSIGPRTVRKLLTRWPSLEEMFQSSFEQLKLAGLPDKISHLITRFDRNTVEADLLWETKKEHHLLTWFDANYPPLLKEIADPPTVIYAKGQLACLKKPTVAMVGSRKPSFTGAETAKNFAQELALQGITIVSGLALGIDSEAHKGCLAANGCTIAVMGTGMGVIYPSQNQGLAEKICAEGLLITEFSLKKPAKAGHFPRRNRIISGLSLITLVVEAAIRSGSLITARLALEQNRDVLAIPGSIHNPQARGCHYLLQEGAKLVTNYQDVLDELGISRINLVRCEAQSLARDDKNLVKCIGFEMTTVDQLIQRSGLGVEEVLRGLATLEIAGTIQAVPGGYMRSTYER